MKLSFNSNAYIRYPIEIAIEHIAKLGYEGIEIARTHPLHELGKQDREKVFRMIKSYGLEVSSTQGGIPCLDTEFAKQRIDLAADLQ